LVLERLNLVKEAITAYTQALKLDPENTKILNQRGWLQVSLRQNELARADFAKVVHIDPANAEAHSLLSYVLACQKKSATEVRRQASQALLHLSGPHPNLVLYNVACAYAELSRTDKEHKTELEDLAIALLQRAVEVWSEQGRKGLNQIELIKNDPALKPLGGRAEFKKLHE
jgi:tetratricopeptide (TPR) repeat protein